MNEVSTTMKLLRIEKGINQEQLAEQLHVTRQAVSSWETGKTQPDIDTLLRLCCIYHIDDVLEIFGYQPAKKPHFNLSAQEKDLVIQYRNHPEMHLAVQRLLEMKE